MKREGEENKTVLEGIKDTIQEIVEEKNSIEKEIEKIKEVLMKGGKSKEEMEAESRQLQNLEKSVEKLKGPLVQLSMDIRASLPSSSNMIMEANAPQLLQKSFMKDVEALKQMQAEMLREKYEPDKEMKEKKVEKVEKEAFMKPSEPRRKELSPGRSKPEWENMQSKELANEGMFITHMTEKEVSVKASSVQKSQEPVRKEEEMKKAF